MLDRFHASLRHWLRLLGGTTPRAHVLERPGVTGSVFPAAPERSVVNSVVFDDAAALAAAYDDFAAAYDEIGAAWTVWARPGHAEAVALLESKGHVLDAAPEAMARDLRQPPPRPTDLDDWTAAGDIAEVGPINDVAYAFGTDSFARAFRGMSPEAFRVYLASVDGRPCASTTTVDLDGNCEVTMVAVLPEARGRGLAGKLIAHALADAAERGMETSTLAATEMGRPTYERLGYRPLGPVQMWELRRA